MKDKDFYSKKFFEERKTFFQEIHKLYPNNPWLNKATETMKGFSKEQHIDMLEEAYILYEDMSKAGESGEPVDSDKSEVLFDLFVSHVERFLTIDSETYNEIIELCRGDKTQIVSVNRNYADYLYQLLVFYKYKLFKNA